MKVEIDLCIPDEYEFVRYGKMKPGEIGLRQGLPYLYFQYSDEMCKNDFFIIKKKVKLTKTLQDRDIYYPYYIGVIGCKQ